MTKADFDLWLKITAITYEELEAKRLQMLEEQIKALRSENRNLKPYWMSLPSNYIPKPNCCIWCPDQLTEETDDKT